MRIFSINLRNSLKTSITWSIVLGIFMGLVLIFYPYLGHNGALDKFQSTAESMSYTLQVLMGLDDYPNFSAFWGYYGYFFKLIAYVSMIFAVLLGSRALAEEEGEGTIEFLYSMPYSRSEIVTGKLLSSFLLYFIFLAITIGITVLVIACFSFSEGIIKTILVVLPLFIGMLFNGLLFVSFGLLFSALLRGRSECSTLTVSLVLISFILGFTGKIINMGLLTKLSVIINCSPHRMIASGPSLLLIVVEIVLTAIFVALSYTIYNRKNFHFD